tara:strand:+ start:1569 stop:2162 length:594 start_codon:yes stop_codon:yes gene_type:complete
MNYFLYKLKKKKLVTNLQYKEFNLIPSVERFSIISSTTNGAKMITGIEDKLKKLKIILPHAPAPAANYVPTVLVGDILYVSGQISADDNGMITGKLGATMSVEEGTKAARACAISLLAQVKNACNGDLERLVRVVKLTGFVNSSSDFIDQPKVINGASDLLVSVLGSQGHHSRSAVSAASLPLGVAVEIEGIFQIKP